MNVQDLIRPLVQCRIGTVSTSLTFVRTATKRAAGSKTSMKDSAGRRLGAKAGDGELVRVGQIVYRQRGTKIFPGENMGIGRDHTLFAEEPGYVRYYYDPFHPKRKLVGIAMEKHARLPTPHFEPRKRRFGYDVIEDPSKADQERQVMKRKEYLIRPELDKEYQKREAKRQQRKEGLLNQLENELAYKFESETDKQLIGERLLNTYNYLAGGRSVEEARKLVDQDYVQDAKIAKEFRGDESLLSGLEHYKQLMAQLDQAVTFDPEKKLGKVYSEQELEAMSNEAIAEADKVLSNQSNYASVYECRKEVEKILAKPCFSLRHRHALLKKYTAALLAAVAPRELPVDQIEKLVKEKKGKMIKKWNYERRRVDVLFAPFSPTFQ